ncbi:MAG TPA: OmpA family protein [Thermoanaerobaculia bacterium]|nr:OmpA family protein [Thermoanaerobaculia bacterium]
MRPRFDLPRALSCAAVAALLSAGAAAASDLNLTSVTFPEGKTIDLPMARTNATPNAAKLEAAVKFSGGQAKVEVSYKKMEPAILFGGDISSYVVWAVTRDGAVENLGELIVDSSNASGAGVYQTGKKQFGLMVTAEPYYLVGRPSEYVIATSMGADPKKTANATFAFNGFRTGMVNSDTNTIAGLTYKEKKPVALVQAERAMTLAERSGAAAVNPKAIEEAQRALTQAENSTKSGGSARAVTDYARRAVALSAEAMRDLGRKMEADAEAAKKAALAESQMTVAQLREAQARLEADKAMLLAGQEQLRKEKAELEGRLKTSMSSIMETRESARGAVMSLPGISFETGKAVLKPSAQLTLAKLAGIAQVFPNINMRVEGYTDSTGNAAANQKLSEARARAVYDFLKAQGVADTRLAFQGLGPASPVADNKTAEGRAKNRRVEIVAAAGEIKPVSAN